MATRQESVRLSLIDDFTSTAARIAASTAMLEKRMDSLDGTTIRTSRSTSVIARDADSMARSADQGANSINQLTGRMRIFGELAASVGPATIPIAGLAIPAVAGLASQFGFAALAGGTAIAAFQGVGDALKAMNKAQLEPTTANLQAAQAAMEQISPAAQDMVRQLQSMGPALKDIRDVAAEGMFPGLTEGLDSIEKLFPKVERIVGAVAGELGSIAADSGESLASGRWAEFFDFLATDAPSALSELASATGNVAHAAAEMWMAFDPLNDSFSRWLVDATAGLDDWASGLSGTAGFAEFVDYLRTTGPQVADTLGAIGNALLQMVQAAAPIAGPILGGIEAFAKAVAAIADSDLGTPIFGALAAVSALNLAMRASAAVSATAFGGPALAGIQRQSKALGSLRADWAAYNAVQRTAQGRAQASGAQMIASRAAAARLGATMRQTGAAVGKTGALVGGLAIATSGAADGIGMTNTASLALMGTMVGGGLGAAIGATVGGVLDLSHANDGLNDSLTQLGAMAGKVDFGTFNQQLDDTQKKINDLADSDGLGDFITDTLKRTSATMSGKGFRTDSIVKNLQAEADAASSRQVMAGRNAAAALTSQQSAAASQAAANGYQMTADAAREAAMSVQQMTAAIEAANAAMGHVSAKDALRSAVLDAKDFVRESGKVLKGNGDIKRGSEAVQRAGISARSQLVQIGTSAQQAGEKMKEGFGKTKFLDNARQQFVSVAKAMGMSGPAAQRMANDFGLIDRIKINPKNVKVTETGSAAARARVAAMRAEIERLKPKTVQANEKGAAAARARIAALRAAIASLQSKTINVTTIYTRKNAASNRGPGGVTSAYGNIFGSVPESPEVRRYAMGDVANRHMPELAGPGTTRIWREPETQGEAYIPLANDDRRPRARSIAEETIALLGGDPDSIEWFAKGGRRGGKRRGNGPGRNDGLVKRELKDFNAALARSTAMIDNETAARDDLVSRQENLKSSVSGAFTSDLFGESSVWSAGGGLGDAFGKMSADIAKANAFKSVLGQLAGVGLDGDAFAAIASTGDIGKAQALVSSGRVAEFESLYNQRASAAGAVGNLAGQAAYGAEIAKSNVHLSSLSASNKRLEQKVEALTKELKTHPDRQAKGINKAAVAGKKKGRK